jgi:hypothetical protein
MGDGIATVTTLLSRVTEVFTSVMGMSADVGTTIMANPILLMGVLLFVSGAGIGFFRRLLGMT